MTVPHARGACPRLAKPMQTGDGLLARLVTAGPIPLDAFIGLCAAAQEHGNGMMEISSRGSLQVRGLTPVSAPLFASAVAGLDIELCER
jgi:precorrin-3B synthase